MATLEDLGFFGRPIGQNAPVGVDELGNPVYRNALSGREFGMDMGAQDPQQRAAAYIDRVRGIEGGGNALTQFNRPTAGVQARNALTALAQGALQGVTAPGRAAKGEPVTYGDAYATALDYGLLGAPMAAPEGALRNMAARTVESPAQEVARLLREGRADDVTDQMLARLSPNDEAELFRLYDEGATGMDLPMDAASRSERARALGFEGETYHGTDIDFPAASVDMGQGERNATGFFSSSSPDVAESYTSSDGGRIMPLTSRNAFGGPIIDAQGSPWNDIGPDAPAYHPSVGDETVGDFYWRILDDLNSEGFDRGLSTNAIARDARFEGDSYAQFLNLIDRGAGAPFNLESYKPSDVRVDFSPNNIRSRFARFDPRLSRLSNLSAGTAGAGLALSQIQSEMDAQGVTE